ncbi:MAG: YdcF family protein [Clostridia bacterium]|nr:YdcF family protein [Clostridia bacterium]
MYTRWRLYILAVFAVALAACILLIAVLRKHGHKISAFQGTLFTVGAMLTLETVIIMGLSNFNLGVIMPALLGVPMILLAPLVPHMDHGFLRALKWFAVAGYSAAAVLFAVCGFLMLSAQHGAKDTDADVVIVLGAAVHGEKVTWVLENRLETAKEFLEAHPDAVCVVSGGQGPGESVTEGSAMKKYLVERGVPAERIYAEEKATSTPENFRYAMEIVENEIGTGKKIAFVTTDFHVYRAGRVARAQGLEAKGIAAPDVWYLRLNNFLRECVGIFGYAVTGRF